MRNSFPAADVFRAACEAGGCRRGCGSCSCCCSRNEPQPGQLVRVLVLPRLLRAGWPQGQAASHADDVRRVAAGCSCFHRPPGHHTRKPLPMAGLECIAWPAGTRCGATLTQRHRIHLGCCAAAALPGQLV